jgi:hypothetical protein
MADGDPFAKSSTGVADGNDFIIDGSSSSTGAIDLTELGGTGDCDVYREVDTATDGTWATSVLIEQPSGTWHSQKDVLTISQNANVRLRVNNTSGNPQDFYAAGYEVADGA